MDELRRDLRAAFDRQQAGLGSLAGVRERVLQEALAAAPGSGRRLLPVAAAAAAVLLAVVAVGTLMLARAGTRPLPAASSTPGAVPSALPSAAASPAATPAPTPATAPVAGPLQVDAATPVILFPDPGDQDQVDGITWDGRSFGRVGTGVRNGFWSDPTGTLYATSGQRDIRDRRGAIVATWDTGSKGFGAWADDGRHYCQMVTPGSPHAAPQPATLQLVSPGQPPRDVAQVGTVSD